MVEWQISCSLYLLGLFSSRDKTQPYSIFHKRVFYQVDLDMIQSKLSIMYTTPYESSRISIAEE